MLNTVRILSFLVEALAALVLLRKEHDLIEWSIFGRVNFIQRQNNDFLVRKMSVVVRDYMGIYRGCQDLYKY